MILSNETIDALLDIVAHRRGGSITFGTYHLEQLDQALHELRDYRAEHLDYRIDWDKVREVQRQEKIDQLAAICDLVRNREAPLWEIVYRHGPVVGVFPPECIAKGQDVLRTILNPAFLDEHHLWDFEVAVATILGLITPPVIDEAHIRKLEADVRAWTDYPNIVDRRKAEVAVVALEELTNLALAAVKEPK